MKLSKIIPVSKPVCRLSYPDNPHNLCRRFDPPLSVCFSCKGQHLENRRYYYYCATCDLEFHRGCHLFPPEIKHPFHLLHPLTLIFLDPDFQSSRIPIDWPDSSSESDDYDSYEENSGSYEGHIVKCNYCRKNLQPEEFGMAYYHCSTCNFSLHRICAYIRPPLTIENLKSHDHTLTLFPRRAPLPCDACGFSLDAPFFDHVYSCLLCNYMLACGVCRKTVDVNYGSYSCTKGCRYALHSKCATNKKVWDGKDLEGVREEEEEILEPFLWIDEETIQHFSHDHHHLKLRQNGGSHDNEFCEACTLPMTVSDRFYSCIKCEFVLHETCASLPRRKHHPVHKHPLTLFHPSSSYRHKVERKYYRDGFFTCDGCIRNCCGFIYRCSEKDCEFQLDVRCASLPDPSIHDCHPPDHPLFFNFTSGSCMGFESVACDLSEYLECIQCESFLCLHCATLPCVAHYKHDKHPLTLCYGEEETRDLKYWCEIFENKLYATKWFYTCDSCRVTLHVKCLLGKEPGLPLGYHYYMTRRIMRIRETEKLEEEAEVELANE
ncbi:BnaA05g16070D [Brassica napus]|uniref:BnaA05g16070D protein n=1 Tax=Brassica napus TaxID=3708 RepID=A0A078GS79_BRANA|nr:BnaA05g16070D [Brassica napus]